MPRSSSDSFTSKLTAAARRTKKPNEYHAALASLRDGLRHNPTGTLHIPTAITSVFAMAARARRSVGAAESYDGL